MIKVECTSCKNPYDLDEKRLPATGLRMRCPKCGVSFLVYPDGRTAAAPAVKPTLQGTGIPGAPPPAPGAVAKKPVVPPPPPSRDLDLLSEPPEPEVKKITGAFTSGPARGAAGVPKISEVDLPGLPQRRPGGVFGDDLDLPVASGVKKTTAPDIDLPAPKPAAPRSPAPRSPAPPTPAPRSAIALDDDLDLPSPRMPTGAGVKKITGGVDLPAPKRAALDFDAPDLPAPRAQKKPPVADDLDLPAPRSRTTPSDLDLPAPRAARSEVDLPAPRSRATPMELDLPAPRGQGAPIELDLPAPRGKAPSLDLDLPAPRGPASRQAPSLDLDLPAPRGPASRQGAPSLDLDLPAPRGRGGPPAAPARMSSALAATGTPFDDDLDGPPPLAAKGGFDLDLPAPRGRGLDVLDLPAPKGDVTDLPAAAGAVDLPRPSFGSLDLPAPLGASDLPAARGASDLPASRGAADLPSLRGGDSSLLPGTRAGVPKRTGERAAFDLPIPGAGPSLPPSAPSFPPGSGPGQSAPGRGAGRGEGAEASSSFGELDLPLPDRRPTAEPLRERNHGEVELPGAEGTEFNDIPVERTSLPPNPGALPLARPATKAAAPPAAKQAGRGRRGALIGVGLVAVLGAIGGALTLTPYGPFGWYVIEQYLPGSGNAAAVATVVAEADRLALLDSYSDSADALVQLGTARRGAGLNRALLARSLMHESLHEVRWDDASGSARAAAIRQRLEERGTDEPSLALALAANHLRDGNFPRALGLIDRARSFAPDDPFVDLVEAEAALGQDDAATALQAFQAALAHGGGARAQWGIARALSSTPGADPAAITAAVDATLALAPQHGDALLARGRAAHERGNDALALTDIAAVVGMADIGEPPMRLVSPPHLRSEAWAVSGAIHEDAGRLHQALESYTQAIDADGSRIDALLGAGRVLLVDRPADALTRFESVIEREDASAAALPSGRTAAQEARLGAARAMLDLDRDQEALATLQNLVLELPEDAEMHLWLGRAQELLDDTESAEDSYTEAIRLQPADFDGYLFQARLYQSLHRDSDAVAILESARGAVPETAEMREALGTYELGLNRLPEAIVEFRRALAIDHALPAARFGLGVALRRSGDFDAALVAFDELARIDAGHPGLALERGLLFEARGESDRAVEYYTQALAERPDDPELLLRLGAAQVGAGEIDEAEDTLQRVQEMLPASAEAEHFVGRVAFARHNYPEASQHFERAISLDASRGEFFVYAAWAALENRSLGVARERADSAIARDPSLGDAYWIRGEVRLATGLVRDALVDLERALSLRPTRYEALAAMGRCYDELRMLTAAIDAYNRAVTAVDTNGEWWFRLGRLHMDADHARDGARALGRAAVLGDRMEPQPSWLPDAHRILGDALRLTSDRAGAIEHFRRYLEIAPTDAVDRPEVRSALLDLGVDPSER